MKLTWWTYEFRLVALHDWYLSTKPSLCIFDERLMVIVDLVLLVVVVRLDQPHLLHLISCLTQVFLIHNPFFTRLSSLLSTTDHFNFFYLFPLFINLKSSKKFYFHLFISYFFKDFTRYLFYVLSENKIQT